MSDEPKASKKSPSGTSSGGGGGRWLIVLGTIGLLAGWWIVYQPLRPDSELLPPLAGVTNRVPEAITNFAHNVRSLTNVVPTNLWPVPPVPSPTNVPPVQVRTSSPPATNLTARPPMVTNVPPMPVPPPPPVPREMRLPQNVFEAQLALDRMGISPGSLDGVAGSQTRAAIRSFQQREALPETGELDSATRSRLAFLPPAYVNYTVTSADIARLRPVSSTWLGKSQQDRLDYSTIIELVSELGHAHPDYLRRINPSLNWTNVTAGTVVTIPNASRPSPRSRAALVRIKLSERTLRAFDQNGRLLAHFPVSIAQFVEKRLVGELRVEKAAEGPNYRFDPKVFPESTEGRKLGRPLMLPPGPNNPVGTAWIGLDKPGYGIHGTPAPEAVGRTESHGCFRLANWNAEYLLKLVWKGMPVRVDP